MATPVLQFKRGQQSNVGIASFQAGEPGFVTDEYNFYIGVDGTAANQQFFGSSRYWKKETVSAGGGVNLVSAHSVGSAGTSITLSAPASVGAAITYYFPATDGVSSAALITDGNGNLSWSNSFSDSIFSGITTYTNTTDNTLANPDTGAVQIDGGLGVNKNVSIGGSLYVAGYSEFIGVVTFRGGTINLGDGNTDDINVSGEFISNLVPNDNDSYDIGISGKAWRHANFSGVGTFATGAVVDNIQIGITSTNEINTSSGNLTIDSAGGTVTIDDQLSVSGVATFVQGLYYDVGNFDGPNGITYFNNNGKLIGAASTESAISQSYYILTTEEVSGVPVWTSTIDGGQF